MTMQCEDAHQAIVELEERRYRAMIAADVEMLSRLLAERIVYTHSTGNRDTKATYLDKVATGNLQYLEITRPEEVVVIEGETAVVAGRMTARIRLGGEERQLDNRCLAVWAQVAGSWQLIAFQGSIIPKG